MTKFETLVEIGFWIRSIDPSLIPQVKDFVPIPPEPRKQDVVPIPSPKRTKKRKAEDDIIAPEKKRSKRKVESPEERENFFTKVDIARKKSLSLPKFDEIKVSKWTPESSINISKKKWRYEDKINEERFIKIFRLKSRHIRDSDPPFMPFRRSSLLKDLPSIELIELKTDFFFSNINYPCKDGCEQCKLGKEVLDLYKPSHDRSHKPSKCIIIDEDKNEIQWVEPELYQTYVDMAKKSTRDTGLLS